MKRFSQRIGAAGSLLTLQLEGMNEELRNSLWNVIHITYDDRVSWKHLLTIAGLHFFKVPIDEIPIREDRCRDWLKLRFNKFVWFEVYDFVEFLAVRHEAILGRTVADSQKLIERFNFVLEREFSGYRFVAGILAPISSNEETGALMEAINETDMLGHIGASEHLKTALKLLSLKPEPDYRNSIKESISAVEAVAKRLSTSRSPGLAGALAELEKCSPIHAALRGAFIKLYGYTSDEGGIRHAMTEDSNVGFDEAKYMLVSCSAFVNYLIMRGARVGVNS